jgi:hypothetical protein
MGDREVIYNSANALSRARRLIPNFEGELVSGCSHDMAAAACHGRGAPLCRTN